MATSIEEIVLRMKLDAAEAQRGTDAMLSQQRMAAREYTSFWDAALAKREAAEIATAKSIAAEKATIEAEANRASLARLEKNEAEKTAAARAWTEERAAMSAIGSGSGGYGSGFKTAEQKALEGGESEGKKLIKDMGEGAAIGAGLKAGAKAVHGNVLTESMVLVREATRGAYNRMVSSFLMLLSFMGLTAATIIGSIPIIAAGALGIWKSFDIKHQLGDMQGHYGSDKLYQETLDLQRKQLEKEIEKLNAGGLLSKTQNAQITGLFGENSLRGLKGIRNIIKPLLPEGFSTKIETTDEKIKKADDLAKREQDALDSLVNRKRTQRQLEDDITDKRNEQIKLQAQMQQMDQSSVEYHEARAKLLGIEVDLQKDLNQQAEQEKAQQDAQREWKKWSDSAARTYMKDQIASAMEGTVFPTLEDLAGRNRVARLNRAYGRGGAYDLGAGGGQFSDIAYDALLAQKQQAWDREHGNLGQADLDRKRYIKDVDYLAANGAASPQQLLSKIEDNTAKLHTLWKTLVSSGAIKTDIIGTE